MASTRITNQLGWMRRGIPRILNSCQPSPTAPPPARQPGQARHQKADPRKVACQMPTHAPPPAQDLRTAAAGPGRSGRPSGRRCHRRHRRGRVASIRRSGRTPGPVCRRAGRSPRLPAGVGGGRSRWGHAGPAGGRQGAWDSPAARFGEPAALPGAGRKTGLRALESPAHPQPGGSAAGSRLRGGGGCPATRCLAT